jgi:hypothetical protein
MLFLWASVFSFGSIHHFSRLGEHFFWLLHFPPQKSPLEKSPSKKSPSEKSPNLGESLGLIGPGFFWISGLAVAHSPLLRKKIFFVYPPASHSLPHPIQFSALKSPHKKDTRTLFTRPFIHLQSAILCFPQCIHPFRARHDSRKLDWPPYPSPPPPLNIPKISPHPSPHFQLCISSFPSFRLHRTHLLLLLPSVPAPAT